MTFIFYIILSPYRCSFTEDASKKHPFPCPCSYRTALTHYLDITHPPRTHVLGELAEYTDNPQDKEFLQKMTHATEEGKVQKTHRLYYLFIGSAFKRERENILELFFGLFNLLHGEAWTIFRFSIVSQSGH